MPCLPIPPIKYFACPNMDFYYIKLRFKRKKSKEGYNEAAKGKRINPVIPHSFNANIYGKFYGNRFYKN